MTENEAKTKWCPFVRYEGDHGGTFNRGIVGFGGAINDHEAAQGAICNCIASGCMAWRWERPGKFQAIMKYRDETGCSATEAKDYVDQNNPELTMEPTEGYCGIVGRD